MSEIERRRCPLPLSRFWPPDWPSPEMASIIEQYSYDIVTEIFEPHPVARDLNQLDTQIIAKMKANSRAAHHALKADGQMGRVLDIYASLLETDVLCPERATST
jgi:hypothetical protein